MAARATDPVYVLDYEAVCPLGLGRKEIAEGLRSDRSGQDTVKRFDASALPVDQAAEVREGIDQWLDTWPADIVEAARFDRKIELALACAAMAQDRFAALMDDVPPARRGIVLGVGLDVSPLERVAKAILDGGRASFDVEDLVLINPLGSGLGRVFNLTDVATLTLANRFACEGRQDTVLTACSSSSQALAHGVDAIRDGEADVVLVGGTDSLLNLPAFSAFAKLGVIQPSRGNGDPVCRPCDRSRRGTLLGEGAGIVVLASQAHVHEHDIEADVVIRGYGVTLDGHHITSPDPDGDGMKRAMARALADAGIERGDLDYINLHGTGTRANDAIELSAVAAVAGSDVTPPMVSSTKDRHGHLIAAAGVMEAIVVLESMRQDLVFRTLNLRSPIETNGLDLVMGENRSRDLSLCMSNSFAFGGINTSIVFGRERA